MISKACSSRTTTVVRTTNPEYLDVWREGQLDVDFIVSSEVETAFAISRTIGVPSARQTDVFADGQVQMAEFDVTQKADSSILGHRCAKCGFRPIPALRRSSAATPSSCRAAARTSAPVTGSSSSARRRLPRTGAS